MSVRTKARLEQLSLKLNTEEECETVCSTFTIFGSCPFWGDKVTTCESIASNCALNNRCIKVHILQAYTGPVGSAPSDNTKIAHPTLHHEGRALSMVLQAVDGSIKRDATSLSALADTALAVGFDWVEYKNTNTVYASVIPDSCQTKIDLAFVLDSSFSLDAAGYESQKKFAGQVVDFFDIGAQATRVASITYESESYVDFDFNQYTQKSKLKRAIKALQFRGGGTNTHFALEDAIATFAKSGRPTVEGVPKVCIVLTDGVSTQGEATKRAAAKLQATNINVFAIGMGNSLDEAELRRIATDPDDEHYFRISDVKSIETFASKMTTYSCNEPTAINPGQTIRYASFASFGICASALPFLSLKSYAPCNMQFA